MEKTYQIKNGTSYDSRTNQSVIDCLENARLNKIRLRIHYGDIETGKDWNERYDVTGYVGRSCGSTKIPLLVFNTRGVGGGGILDHCIIKITLSKGKRVLYQQPNYHQNA